MPSIEKLNKIRKVHKVKISKLFSKIKVQIKFLGNKKKGISLNPTPKNEPVTVTIVRYGKM